MNKKITQSRWLATMFLLVAAMVMPSMAWAETITPSKPSNGDGSMGNPYQISNAEELYWFAGLVNGTLGDVAQNTAACAELTQDITVNENVLWDDGNYNYYISDRITWNPIRDYNGTFDGKGHTISGLLINNDNSTGGDDFGFFGFTTANSEIRNLGIVDSYFYDCYAIGGVCGTNRGTIKNCYNKSTIKGKDRIGGVCGDNFGTITNCYNSGKVTILEGEMRGGVCGVNNGTITNCYNLSGTVTDDKGNEYVDGSAKSKTAEQFASGEVCYLLNGSTSKGTAENALAWYQNLTAWGDASPVLTSTGENTVYGAYKHGETSPTCSNSESDLAMFHAHAYDSSATDEASGNHDKSYQSVFNWVDIADKTNATVTATFTYAVCGNVVNTEALTVENDDSKANTEANCTENGNNYYKTSYSFTGETFSSKYTQTLHALGHNMNAITFNEAQKIYSNQCQREGCGYIGYYATSNGSVEAIKDPEGDGFTANYLTLEDATAYDNECVFTVTDFTYTRTFTSTEWTTWYVPFDLTLTEEICAQYDFSRINNVHQYDDNGDGNVDRTVVESFRQNEGVKLKANYPYLVRAKSNADFSMSLPLTNVVPALAETNSIDCQSVDFSYTFTGTYTGMGEGGSNYYDPYTLWTDGTWQHFRSLDPMRHYLTVTPRNSSFASAASLRSIMLSVIGDEGTTGIVNMYSDERKAAETYDLGGRRLPAGASHRGVVIENGKVIYKK